MKLRTFRKKEEGTVAVIVALSMTVLLGFVALAVDFGMMAVCRQSLQNAADAAALAAAADLGAKKPEKVNLTVAEYCAANGFAPADDAVTVSVQTSGTTVTVTLQRSMQMAFSAVVTGEHTRTVSAAATAEATSIFGNCPYAMFAGQHIDDNGSGIDINGNNIAINGDIHSNSDISMKNAVLGPGVQATAVHHTDPHSDGWKPGQIARDMPSYSSFEKALTDMTDTVVFEGSISKDKHDGFQSLIDEAIEVYEDKTGGEGYLTDGLYIHITGDLTFHGNGSTAYEAEFPIVLIADGNIDLNGACINSDYDYPVCVMSKEKNITVNGGGAEFTGIIYAPNGDVTINGNDASFVGSIVAKNITKNGGKTTVSYQDDLDRFLPKSKVHLIA